MKKSNKNKKLVYLLDDDPVFSYTLELWLEVQGYRVKSFSNIYSFLRGLRHCKPDVVILDFALNENYEGLETGADVAKRISEDYNDLPVIMLSAQENIQIAVDLFAIHIVDYVAKDDNFHMNLKQILKNLMKMSDLKSEIKDLKTQVKTRIRRFCYVLGSALVLWLINLIV